MHILILLLASLAAFAQIPAPGQGGGGSSTAGALVLLESKTASASATLAFTACISGTYDEYLIEFVNILPATDGATLLMRVSTDNGSTYVSTASYSYWDYRFDSGTGGVGGATGATSIILAETNGIGNASAFGLIGSIKLFDPQSASKHKAIVGDVVFRSAAGTRIKHTLAGAYEANTAITGFHFLASSGNITSGTIRCYGVAKS